MGIFWDTEANTLYKGKRTNVIGSVFSHQGGLELLEEGAGFQMRDLDERQAQLSSRDTISSTTTASRWHLRMGHLGVEALEHLTEHVAGIRMKGPSTVECDSCAQGKARARISRREPDFSDSKPMTKLHIDWTDYTPDDNDFSRAMYITDSATGYVFDYYQQGKIYGEDCAAILRDLNAWARVRDFKIEGVRSDAELMSKPVKRWAEREGVVLEPSAPYASQQNGRAERSGGVVTTTARTLRISANLPASLWRELSQAAVYLLNRSPKKRLGWKTPFEAMFGRPPQLYHLKTYGCKAFPLTTDAQLHRNKRKRLEPRAYVGYLVGYMSTNIYRIWVPNTGRILVTRDVVFNEADVYTGTLPREEAVNVTEVSQQNIYEQAGSQEEESVYDNATSTLNAPPAQGAQDLGGGNGGPSEHVDIGKEVGLPTPPESPASMALVSIPVARKSTGWARSSQEQRLALMDVAVGLSRPNTALMAGDLRRPIMALNVVRGHEPIGYSPRSEATRDALTRSELSLTTAAVPPLLLKDLPAKPEHWRDVRDHPMRPEFERAQTDHLESHRQQGSWEEVDVTAAAGHKILSSQWVYSYKVDKLGRYKECKARLVVCGNQQEANSLETRAETLSGAAFRIMMAVVAEFDLETIQLDAVNAFVNADLDEVVFMGMPQGYRKRGKVLRLRKALYGLRRSPLLWLSFLAKLFKSLGFSSVPDEPCIMLCRGLIVFFFVDDIVIAFPKSKTKKANEVVAALQRKIKLKVLGEIEWFLGIHIIRDRKARKIHLSQRAYIAKMARAFCTEEELTGKLPTTPLVSVMPKYTDEHVPPETIRIYLKIVGSCLFVSITTRPDAAFAVSKLASHNANPGPIQVQAARRLVGYLYATRNYGISFGGQVPGSPDLIISSDASYGDNKEDRKSSDGCMIRLFGGPVFWMAKKQNTVATSSTEAELLSLSRAAKNAIFLSRIMHAVGLRFSEALTINCDNTNTLRLIKNDSIKLQTALRHVDIHNHWLRQEYKEGRVDFKWVRTDEMEADGLTKCLSADKHAHFQELIQVTDLSAVLPPEASAQERGPFSAEATWDDDYRNMPAVFEAVRI